MRRFTQGMMLTAMLGLLPSTSVYAESVDLLEVYHLAQQRDASFAAAKETFTAAQEKAIQGRSGLLPNIVASADYGYQHSESDFGTTTRKNTSDSRSVGLSVVQPLYNKSSAASYRQGKLVSHQAEDAFTLSKQDLIIRVSEAYFAVLAAQESVRVSQAQKRAFAENLERAKLTFEIGTATITDKLEAQARFDLSRAEEIAAVNALEVAKQQLASIIGELPKDLADIGQETSLPELTPTDMQEWINLAIENNAQLKVAQQTISLRSEDLEIARSNHFPTLNLVGQAVNQQQYSSFTNSDIDTTQYGVSLEFQLPLYSGGLTSSQVREVLALRDEAKEQAEKTRRDITLQTQQAYLAVINGRLRVEALRQAVTSSQSALDATQKGVEVGVRTNLDLLDAQQQLFATRRDFAVAKYNYLLDVLRLKSASGLLQESDVENINGMLKG